VFIEKKPSSNFSSQIEHVDIKIDGLKQYNDSSALATKSFKSSERGVKLSFYWDIFGIE